MNHLIIDTLHTMQFVSPEMVEAAGRNFGQVHAKVHNKTGAGKEFLGWLDLPSADNRALLKNIKADVDTLIPEVDVVVVIGIGGSYLGARAVIDALKSPFGVGTQAPQIVYAGHHLSQDYLSSLMQYLDTRRYAIVVISKSGTTTEPAVAFRLLKNHLINKLGIEKAKNHIIAITDKARGALKGSADKDGYKTYVIPDDVGGRYSVLTPVGLLPVAFAGFDIEQLLKGAADMSEVLQNNTTLDNNPAALYAVVRNLLYQQGKHIEILAAYNPALSYFIEWWKQLYGESEGKEHKGIFPAGVNFTSDLHSMGQYIQDGLRCIFETHLEVMHPNEQVLIPRETNDADGLNYLAGKEVDFVNKMAALGTQQAHVEGGVPCIRIQIEKINEYNIGQLIFFYETACAYSGYMLGVNPFDQPGVEAYKKNMFRLLGKPGV